jgi:mono/diheme cytochrome c family protein
MKTTWISVSLLLAAASLPGQIFPKTWDEAALATMQTPLLDPARTPKHMGSGAYQSLPVLPIYKSYPVYAAGREPAGYLDRLRTLAPEIIAHPTGEDVFDAPTFFENPQQSLTSPLFFPAANVPIANGGIYPYLRYVIRKKGELELGGNSCGGCHTRVMPDGSVVKGAQGNFPVDRVIAASLRALAAQDPAAGAGLVNQFVRPMLRFFYAAPWLQPDPYERVANLSLEELATAWSQVPDGVMTRDGSTFDARPQIPDLIGIRDRLYLNHTGTHLHRSIADLMRYAALAQGADLGSSWGDFRLVEQMPPFAARLSDESLYALAGYLYALRPPANPHHSDSQTRAGRMIFERQGCGACHTAPLYTNNQRIAAADIGTDPELATHSRRGTGYYKVPSLKGVWYRGPFGHGGDAATLEAWFDSARLTAAEPVPGHNYGLGLPPAEKAALIAFLKTL